MNGAGSVAFRVHGTPKTQGSMFSPKKGVVLHQQSAKLKSWRTAVAEEAAVAWNAPPVTGPVSVQMIFKFHRPKWHYGTGRNSDVVRAGSPRDYTKKPDLDKLERAILDALTGVIYNDDAQVNEIHSQKEYTLEGEGAIIIINTEPEEVEP